MQQDRLVRGVTVLGITVLVWGGTWPVAKDALESIDPLWLTAIRYAIVPLMFVAVLCKIEGRQALRYEGQFWNAAWLGALGFAGYNAFAFVGLKFTSPEHVPLISALQAPLTAIAIWLWRGQRPATFTLACVVVAFVGVALVVTKGDPFAAMSGGSLLGDAMVLVGAIAWIVYGFGVVKFSHWSPLRYTTLTVIPGEIAIVAVTLVAYSAGLAPMPTAAIVGDVFWQLAYLTLFTGFVGVLCWNAGIAALGPLNAGLAVNLIPVVTFSIRVWQGYRFQAIEIVGAVLVLGALIANNLYLRRTLRRPA